MTRECQGVLMPTPDERARSLWRNRDYQLLVTGGTISGIGSRMSGIAFPLLTYWLTESPVMVGVVGAAEVLGMVVFGLPAGALVDRWGQRRSMIWSALVAAAAYATVVLAYDAGALTVAHLAVAGAVAGGAAALYGPADTAALREVVPSEDLGTAMSVSQGRMAFAGLAGPPLGGALFSIARAMPVLVDVFSYLAAALCAKAVRAPLAAPEVAEGEREKMAVAVRVGVSFIWHHPALRPIMLIASVLNFAANGFLLVLIIVMQQRHVAPTVIGLLETAMAVAMLVGAVLSSRLLKRYRTGVLMVAGGWMLTLAFAVIAVVSSTWLVLVVLGLGTLLLPPLNAGLMSYQLLVTPPQLQGRVLSALMTVAMGLSPLAPLLGGLGLEWWGAVPTLLGFAALFGVCAVMLTVSAPLRSIPLLTEVEQVA